MNYLFVYGSLKRGYALHRWLEEAEAEYVCDVVLPNIALYRMNQAAWFPAAKYTGDPNDVISGEVYRVSDATLNLLDIVESGLFGRKIVPGVQLTEELTVNLKIYVWLYGLPSSAEKIESGVWDG